ncbi:hypothetical protein JW835_10760 [bacterium]|nr:hypothetical protein [bacterium]
MKFFCLLFLLASASAAISGPYLHKADSLYAQRAEGYQPATGLVDTSNINQAIRYYQKALNLSDSTGKEKIYWKLLQCYYYKGNYTTNEKSLKKQHFQKGIEIGSRALETYPNSPGVHFWMGILWGYWSEQVGLLTAGRKGVANNIRHHAKRLIAIEDTFAEGGAYRTLGRLHFKAPKIPVILGWPSKRKSLLYFEKAYLINPKNLFTKQYYAEALYDQGEKSRGLQMMKEILETKETVHGIAEDAFIKKETERFLNEHRE